MSSLLTDVAVICATHDHMQSADDFGYINLPQDPFWNL
jgi:hypothetical protein